MLSLHACPFYPLMGIITETRRHKMQKNIRVDKGRIVSILRIPEENIALKEEHDQSTIRQNKDNTLKQTTLDITYQETWIKIQHKKESKLALIKQENNRKNLSENYYNLLIDEEELIRVESEETKDNDYSNEDLVTDKISSEERDYVPEEEDDVSCNVDNMSIKEVAKQLRLNNYKESKDECMNNTKSESSVEEGEKLQIKEDEGDTKEEAERLHYQIASLHAHLERAEEEAGACQKQLNEKDAVMKEKKKLVQELNEKCKTK